MSLKGYCSLDVTTFVKQEKSTVLERIRKYLKKPILQMFVYAQWHTQVPVWGGGGTLLVKNVNMGVWMLASREILGATPFRTLETPCFSTSPSESCQNLRVEGPSSINSPIEFSKFRWHKLLARRRNKNVPYETSRQNLFIQTFVAVLKCQ